jgi:hypothetical protein
MAGENIRVVQESLGHHSIKTTLRYQACLPMFSSPRSSRLRVNPLVCSSPADPEPPELALRRLALTVDRLTALAVRLPQAAFVRGP